MIEDFYVDEFITRGNEGRRRFLFTESEHLHPSLTQAGRKPGEIAVAAHNAKSIYSS